MAEAAVEPMGWERALMAAEKVRERLLRAARALDAAGVPYAVAGGNAVAEWVGRVDEDAVRNTRDVDILIRRSVFPAAGACLETVGFIYHELHDIDTFIDGRKASQVVESISSTPARRFDGTTTTICPRSKNRNDPSTFKSSTSKHFCS